MSPIDRRSVLAGLGVAGGAFASSTSTHAAPAPAPAPGTSDRQQRIVARALENVHPIAFDGSTFGGPGWDFLVDASRGSEFVLLGEEHGLVEIPLLARALFLALRPSGFDTLAIEISPPIAEDLDRAARNGIDGINAFIAKYPPGPAFYFWRTEAELIAAVRGAVSDKRDVLWGLDYEVTGDRRLIERLRAKAPPSAAAAITALADASSRAWETWGATHNPAVIFSFGGDPALARAIRAAWPKPDADATRILDTLEETLEINKLFVGGKGWESNERRARFNRANLVAHLNAAAAAGRHPKVLFKMGESHMMRGVSWTGNFDIGSLVAEAAALRGGKSFSFLVGGGANGHHGVLNPATMGVMDQPVDMLSQLGLTFLTAAVPQPGPVLIDLRPLRPLISSTKALVELNNVEAARNIHAFDALIVWNGSTATQMLAS